MIKIRTGDVLHLRKPHPCGCADFTVLRVGSQVRIVCRSCGRDMNIDRIKLEKAIKSITDADQALAQGKEQTE
ncbi:MAG: DUF951 domain-containing protein [Clostridia bacterium]|nr:DUF951 domain-containing protein [Clostridia bacterium]MBO5841732.1 DUF951 domain-containing protein [Clostridia bacterium]